METFQNGTIGYPRVGQQRQMKWALEKYWAGKSSLAELKEVSSTIAAQTITDQYNEGIEIINVGSHTYYDHILDWIVRFGLIPQRFVDMQAQHGLCKEDMYFAMARGKDQVHALDMTKWFDTNYHNITPEIDQNVIKLAKPDFSDYFDMIKQAISLVGKDRISAEVMGPLTLGYKSVLKGIGINEVMDGLKPLYMDLFRELDLYGVLEIQVHEPALVLEDFHSSTISLGLENWYKDMILGTSKLNLVTYFGDLGNSFPWVINLPNISMISLDFTRGNNLELLDKYGFPSDKIIGVGLIDGRSVWSDANKANNILESIQKFIPNKKFIRLQPSCSLIFLPLDVEMETHIDINIKKNLRFAKQKLKDLVILSKNKTLIQHSLTYNIPQHKKFYDHQLFIRSLSVTQRRHLQLPALGDKKLITSTIGSFPQTTEMRKIRLQYRKGNISSEQYHQAIDQYIAYCIGAQEGIGLDILVHGEPERSDMVEYFAEKMEGFLFTTNGWVQSYGSRYVRPPIIYGIISRRNNQAMTVREYLEAAKHTTAYVKGMLTGPTTILNWSFPRQNGSRYDQTFEIASALRDEISDLEKAGCKIIQVDEPALREGLPLKVSDQTAYLKCAVDGFRLATAIADPSTHIVTHFCYSEFGDIIESIKLMDADQITIENSRSDNAMLKALDSAGFENVIAPGIYDVHSPVIPSIQSLYTRLQSFLQSGIPTSNIMIVPDCGLKTRKWSEVIPSLRNVVQAVEKARAEL